MDGHHTFVRDDLGPFQSSHLNGERVGNHISPVGCPLEPASGRDDALRDADGITVSKREKSNKKPAPLSWINETSFC